MLAELAVNVIALTLAVIALIALELIPPVPFAGRKAPWPPVEVRKPMGWRKRFNARWVAFLLLLVIVGSCCRIWAICPPPPRAGSRTIGTTGPTRVFTPASGNGYTVSPGRL